MEARQSTAPTAEGHHDFVLGRLCHIWHRNGDRPRSFPGFLRSCHVLDLNGNWADSLLIRPYSGHKLPGFGNRLRGDYERVQDVGHGLFGHALRQPPLASFVRSRVHADGCCSEKTSAAPPAAQEPMAWMEPRGEQLRGADVGPQLPAVAASVDVDSSWHW